MSLFVNAYNTRAKKFEVTAEITDRGILVQIDTYDKLKIEQTADQWKILFDAIRHAGEKTQPRPKPKPAPPAFPADDDY